MALPFPPSGLYEKAPGLFCSLSEVSLCTPQHLHLPMRRVSSPHRYTVLVSNRAITVPVSRPLPFPPYKGTRVVPSETGRSARAEKELRVREEQRSVSKIAVQTASLRYWAA